MSKNINDTKYHEYKKKEIYKYLYIFLAIVVITLEILALFNVISMIWGIILFAILYLLKKIILK